MTEAALDRLSFTLPDWRGALKRRVRRPKLPDKKRLVILALDVVGTLFEGGIFVWSLFVPALVLATAFAIDAYINVRAMRRGEPTSVRNPKDRSLALTVLALMFVGAAWASAVLAG